MGWITLDYLELYCSQHRLMVGCADQEEDVWISDLGPHPSNLTSDEIAAVLHATGLFEIRRPTDEDFEDPEGCLVSREELEERIRRMLN
jgi:hypothetical protein